MDERAAIARLAHDVGKHIARIARNLPEKGPIPRALARMLESDLYSLSSGRRASAVFEELASKTHPHHHAAPVRGVASVLNTVRSQLEEIDRLEARVRGGEEAAQRRAASLALEISAQLAGLLREVGEP